ncbi:MAG: FtsQ-type POTRA domain-containing protein [Armatimonadota bacterium]|nr:FtsQ-type POTRA domain-containing protein [bacterium]MDW8319785.1 FtsQ-type POTRA domain-containing protein [Armatimonadota bacterium]
MNARGVAGRRQTEQRTGRNVWRTMKTVLLLVLVGELGVALYTSPALSVKQVIVEGTVLTRPEQVIREIGISNNSSWVFLPMSRIAHRVQLLPTVAEAVVSRGMPGKVYVRVFERQPVALLLTKDGGYWVDEQGVAFWQTTQARGLSIIRSEAQLPVTVGRAVQNKPVQTAIEILHRYVPEYRLPVAQIVVDREGNLCLNMKEGLPPVKIGSSVDLPQKMVRTAELWAQPQIVRQAEYLDVSCVDKPVWKPREKKGAM